MPIAKFYNFRLTVEENRALEEAMRVYGLTMSELLMMAGSETAHRQHFTIPEYQSRHAQPFTELPIRVATGRIIIKAAFPEFYFRLFSKCSEFSKADHLGAWLTGSALDVIAGHQRRGLIGGERIILPPQYQNKSR